MCVFLAVAVFTLCMWNSRAPSHSPLSCIFVVDQCDRGECGKNGSFRTKKCTDGNNEKKRIKRGEKK